MAGIGGICYPISPWQSTSTFSSSEMQLLRDLQTECAMNPLSSVCSRTSPVVAYMGMGLLIVLLTAATNCSGWILLKHIYLKLHHIMILSIHCGSCLRSMNNLCLHETISCWHSRTGNYVDSNLTVSVWFLLSFYSRKLLSKAYENMVPQNLSLALCFSRPSIT